MKQAEGPGLATRVAKWAGWPLGPDQISQLERLAIWLGTEAVAAGALGRRETERVWRRHIADSLAFACGWSTAPDRLADLGAGAGLPGVPLAILWPRTRLALVEKSQRRADLLSRLVGILELQNIQVRLTEAQRLEPYPAIVMRAVMPPREAIQLCLRLLLPDGRAVLGWRRDLTIEQAQLWGAGSGDFEQRRVPARILDETPPLLIMTPRG